jgi:hypothetical protein
VCKAKFDIKYVFLSFDSRPPLLFVQIQAACLELTSICFLRCTANWNR